MGSYSQEIHIGLENKTRATSLQSEIHQRAANTNTIHIDYTQHITTTTTTDI